MRTEVQTCCLCGKDYPPAWSGDDLNGESTMFACQSCLNCVVMDAFRWARRGAVRKHITITVARDMTVDVQKGD